MTTDKIQFTKEKETMLMTLLELIKEYRPSEQVAFSRFPLWWRTLYRIQEVNPTLRRMERIVVYRY